MKRFDQSLRLGTMFPSQTPTPFLSLGRIAHIYQYDLIDCGCTESTYLESLASLSNEPGFWERWSAAALVENWSAAALVKRWGVGAALERWRILGALQRCSVGGALERWRSVGALQDVGSVGALVER